MSITSALNNAITGLTASSRSAELVSSNVSNAMTDGFGRREIQLSARLTGGFGTGVRVDGVERIVDEGVLRDRRLADAELSNASTGLDFYESLQSIIGTPDDPGSLGGRLAQLEGALIEAASRPDINARLDAVVKAAGNVTDALSSASDSIQQLRVDADVGILRSVEQLNSNLERIAEVNALIQRQSASGSDVNALKDQRQNLIDEVAETVPLRIFPRDNGTMTIYSQTGALLLDSEPSVLSFSASPTISADLSIGAGTLSGLEVNGVAIATSGPNSPIAGGKLAALFEVRDELAPQAQTRLDSIARDLIDRVASPAVDPTLAPGDPGFFTDGGAAFDPLNEVGLSSRISVNAAVDPALGGDLWRLRDGIAAPVQGPAGNNSGLVALSEALRADRVPASGDVATVGRSSVGLVGDFASLIGADLSAADSRFSFSSARQESLRAAELADGVDTDQEMQKLLLIEQTYAANAQVIRAADEMIQQLLGL